MSAGKGLGLVALGLAAAGAGVALGSVAERKAVRARREGPDREHDEPFGALPADRTAIVVADDGVRLHLEEVGRPDAPLTAVMVHGLANTLGCWHYQRRDLVHPDDEDLRMVLYDQRGHGRSGRGAADNATLGQLAEDLLRVLEERVPNGPLVLFGHSLGGMTILEFLALRPDLLDGRILGVGLLSTSSGALAETFFGPAATAGRVLHPLLDRRLAASPGVRRSGTLIDARRRGSDLSFALTRRFGFGGADVSPSLVEYVQAVVDVVPAEVVVELLPALLAHEREDSLDALAEVPTLIVCGDGDRMTPLAHSRAIAERLPRAQLVTVSGAGHMAHMQSPGYVTMRMRAFIRQVARHHGLYVRPHGPFPA
jgi:pimeloyl-ACP methyl ester carboxylesterase